MIYSMTGFATHRVAIGQQFLHVELRSVNSRFLDLNLRLTDELRQAEPLIREKLTARLQRGKVECRMQLQANATAGAPLCLNEHLMAQLFNAQTQVQTRFPEAKALSVGEVLRWPGVLSDDGVAFEALVPYVAEALDAVLDDFLATRGREGEKLAQIMLTHSQAMRAILKELEPVVPAAVAEYQARLSQRLQEAVATLDEDRVRTEVSLFAQRVDVVEELNRFSTHLDELERILKTGGVSGKRLDFLMQELNREANTLGSKAANLAVTNASLSLKLLIEQVREQVQNIE